MTQDILNADLVIVLIVFIGVVWLLISGNRKNKRGGRGGGGWDDWGDSGGGDGGGGD